MHVPDVVIHSSFDGHLGCGNPLATVNTVAVNIDAVNFFSSLEEVGLSWQSRGRQEPGNACSRWKGTGSWHHGGLAVTRGSVLLGPTRVVQNRGR